MHEHLLQDTDYPDSAALYLPPTLKILQIAAIEPRTLLDTTEPIMTYCLTTHGPPGLQYATYVAIMVENILLVFTVVPHSTLPLLGDCGPRLANCNLPSQSNDSQQKLLNDTRL